MRSLSIAQIIMIRYEMQAQASQLPKDLPALLLLLSSRTHLHRLFPPSSSVYPGSSAQKQRQPFQPVAVGKDPADLECLIWDALLDGFEGDLLRDRVEVVEAD
ncbi:hypothetical protein LB504_007878 [Fusarium proliferatum]|nr:hypothetical protein LB504_007878 [Fusarium proliferatum]